MDSHEPSSTRREFLRKQAGCGFLASLLAQRDDAPARDAGGELTTLSRPAMACRFEIILPAANQPGVQAAQRALDLIDRLERQMSVHRDDSEISAINRRAAGGAVPVEAGLFGLLKLSARLTDETAGAFDVTTRPVGRLWKLCREEGRLPTEGEVEAALERVGMHHARLDEARQTVEFLRQGMQLNLGAIGKGYALDRVAESLKAAGVRDALVHSGHSSICALGSPPWERSWIVSIRPPDGSGRSAATVRLRDATMSTSASVGQSFEVDGKRYGHIIDPRTGWPAQGIWSATAIAPTAAEADGLSTAFCVMGPEATAAYCQEHPGVGAVLICEGEEGGEAGVVSIGNHEQAVEVLV